jgi:hypothetical protein
LLIKIIQFDYIGNDIDSIKKHFTWKNPKLARDGFKRYWEDLREIFLEKYPGCFVCIYKNEMRFYENYFSAFAYADDINTQQKELVAFAFVIGDEIIK